MLVDVTIKLREGVIDPEGENATKALRLLGFKVRSVKTMKKFRIDVESERKNEALRATKDMCEKLLANPVIHEYGIEFCDEK